LIQPIFVAPSHYHIEFSLRLTHAHSFEELPLFRLYQSNQAVRWFIQHRTSSRMERVERKATIEKFEFELADINVSLQEMIATTMHLLSRKQREMDRWKMLAALMSDNPDHKLAHAGDKEELLFGDAVFTTVFIPDDCQCLKETPYYQEAIPPEGARTPLTRQDLPDDCSRSSATEKDGNNVTSNSPLNESMLSAETVSTLGRMRQQETKVRGILSQMKKSLQKSVLVESSRD
jgi:hypothetical protein